MLVLSRKTNERIMIGDNIEVTIIEICGDRVRLGFVAPAHVPIHREEVARRIRDRELAQAASVAS
jgi:carbon storage regulator